MILIFKGGQGRDMLSRCGWILIMYLISIISHRPGWFVLLASILSLLRMILIITIYASILRMILIIIIIHVLVAKWEWLHVNLGFSMDKNASASKQSPATSPGRWTSQTPIKSASRCNAWTSVWTSKSTGTRTSQTPIESAKAARVWTSTRTTLSPQTRIYIYILLFFYFFKTNIYK